MTRSARPLPPVPGDLPEPSLSENALIVLRRRYLGRDEQGVLNETPKELFWRVARSVAEAEGAHGRDADAAARDFYSMMARLEFLPSSPTLMNAGRPLGQLAACFVLPVEDSLDSIFDTLKHAAKVHQSGGGTGFDFSRLRPEGDVVKTTHGVASGPLSFLRIYNAATEEIKQGGTRRGANMGVLRVDHPDILTFIDTKRDPENLRNFNLSVAVTDDFMDALARGGDYDLIHPRSGASVGSLKARDVFRRIAESAWHSGEPGVLFIDRANDANAVHHTETISSTNPCVAGDTWIHTSEGPRQVHELVGRPFIARVDGKDHPTGPEGFFATGQKPLLRLETKAGHTIRVTADHRLRVVTRQDRYTTESEWRSVKDIAPGDHVLLSDHRDQVEWAGDGTEHEGYLLGLLVGDGTFSAGKAVLSTWHPGDLELLDRQPNPRLEDGHAGTGRAMLLGVEGVMAEAAHAARTLPHRGDFRGWAPVKGRQESRLTLKSLTDLAKRFGIEQGAKTITPQVERGGSSFTRGFLRGLFDADGSVQGAQEKGISVRLSQSDLSLLRATQRMLQRLGVISTIYQQRRTAEQRPLPDGRGGKRLYAMRASHELVISGENLVRYERLIGFADRAKATRLTALIDGYRRLPNRERFSAEVVAAVPDGTETVYDVQVPDVHRFDANGFVAHNCGEQFLAPYDSCILGSIDLARHVTYENNNPVVHWEHLRETVQLAVHFLDDVLDVQRFPVREIEEKTLSNRRIGLGVMGFARMLFRLGIAYDSEEGRDTAARVMAFVQKTAHEASERFAEERGVFPNWKGSEWERQGKKMRNAAVTTVAPTGTIGMIADTSGGCEPEFSLVYVKRCLDGTLLSYVVPEVEQTATREGWFRDSLLEEITANGGSLRGLPGVPEHWQKVFVTAHEIAPKDHVRMQAAFQAHVDNAVSKTINLPKNAKPDDVEEAFLLAYQLGCKGITVYREGSRPQQVLNLGGAAEDPPTGMLPEDGACQRCNPVPATVDAPGPRIEDPPQARSSVSAEGTSARTPRDRPTVTKGHTHKVQSGCGDLYVTISEDAVGPLEVIAVRSRANACTSAHLEGTSRLATLALRYGIPTEEIAKALLGVRCNEPHIAPYGIVLGCVDGIGQAIERQALGMLGPQHEVVPLRSLDSYDRPPLAVPKTPPEPSG